ncbi:MAG: hypothetical protein KJ804_12770 [Proteobacteria bacterium]|nr:hypothetical protein [Pseudomonadota bacterium]MBU1059178.1 hypothetical protein [Pseudomonadota bacterium]
MDIAGSSSPLVMHYSILKSANKQPELALQLLQKSLAGITLQDAQVAPREASPIPAQASSGIDIRV